MGLNLMYSSSTYDKTPPKTPNPDPMNFGINRHETIGCGLVVEVHYPNCTNYEGRKVLVYNSVTIDDLIRQGSVDPETFQKWTDVLSVLKLIRRDLREGEVEKNADPSSQTKSR